MGSLISGIVLLIPLYFLSQRFVVFYRANLQQKVLKWKVVQVIKASSFYKYYESYREFTGG
jgi:hypothetical protein